MRRLKILVVCVMLILALNIAANAQQHYNVHNPFPRSETRSNRETMDLFGEIFDIAGADQITDNMPQAAREYIGGDGENFEEILSVENISRIFNFGFIFNIVMSLVGGLAQSAVRNFLPIIALLIVSAVVSITKDLNKSESFSEILNFVLLICLAGTVFYSVRECFFAAQNFLNDIQTYMLSMIPVMASLSTLSGNIASAAANSAGLFVILNVVGAISNGVILPVLQICFALSLAKCLTDNAGAINLSGITSYVRSVLNWIFIFVMTLLVTIVLFQNIIASSADSVAMRTVKFTVSSFVPVVGGIIGDATGTILGSMQAVKSVTGVFGVLVIIITLLPPLISVILHKLLLKISGAFALILGLDKQAGFLNEMNSLLDMTLAVMVAVSVVFIFNITVFIRTMAIV